MKNWELSFGFYPGIMIGFRSYNEAEKNNHVLYIPFVDACLTVYNEQWFKQKNTFGHYSPYEVC
mgnify:CR=1 FL=1